MKNKELSQRIVTGVVLGGLLLVLILFAMTSKVGVEILLGVLVLCALRITWEVYLLRRSTELALAVIFPTLGVLFEVFQTGLYAPLHQLAGSASAIWFVVVAALLFIKYTTAKTSIADLSADLAPSLVLMLSVSLPMALLTALIGSFGGIPFLLWTLIIVSATDIAAYFGGRAFGGPKLAVLVSPGKTWTGLISGVAAAVVVGTIWGAFFLRPLIETSFFMLSILLGFTAQASDLAKSHVKRLAGVKDAGQLLPGHGGLLDRVDGHLGAAALTVFFLVAFT